MELRSSISESMAGNFPQADFHEKVVFVKPDVAGFEYFHVVEQTNFQSFKNSARIDFSPLRFPFIRGAVFIFPGISTLGIYITKKNEEQSAMSPIPRDTDG